MVLQDATSPPNDGLVDNPFPSDNDPYSNTSSTYILDLGNLPRPIPIIGSFIGYRRSQVQAGIIQALAAGQVVLQRPLTAEEIEALSHVWAKKSSIASYGTAFGLGAAAYQAYRTRATFRYPFWTPNAEKFNPDQFFTLKGPLARRMFHVTRAIPYLVLGKILGSIFGESWGTFYAVNQTRLDPRLKEFEEAMKRRASQRLGAPRSATPGQTADERPSPQGRSTWPTEDPRTATLARNNTKNDDDMSPAAGNEAWSDSFDGSSDIASTSAERSPAADTGYAATPYNRASRTSERSRSRDEASRTSGLFPGETEKEVSNTESTWDRIRRSAAGQTSQPKSRPPQETQSEDSFNFPSTDEERQLAKAEAQREFDARVERERRGADFEDRGKRW